MLVAVDIGNSTLTCASIDRAGVVTITRLDNEATPAHLADAVRALCPSPEAVLVSSVVPKVLARFDTALALMGPLLVAGKTLPVTIASAVNEPERVGVDRLLAALAAHRRMAPGAVVVVDFGTAITVDAVDARGTFLGGAIAASAPLQAQALADHAEQLPRVDLDAPGSSIGRDTREAIRVGVFSGTIHMVRGLMKDMAAELEDPVHFVATGGGASLFAGRVGGFALVEPHLVLLGLADAYAEMQSAKG